MGLRVLQLSDCHLSAKPDKPYRGISADANFKATWKAARDWSPDLVLLTGDLSEDASEASYERLASWLPAEPPCLALPGNHDDPATMARWFPRGPWDGPLAYESGEWLVVMLNSALPGRVEGGFSAQDIEALRDVVSASTCPHVLLALHHQPIPVEAPWIDRYPLSDPQPFLGLVDSEARIRCVIWGHIHHHFARERNGVLFLGSPSTAANAVANAERFEADPAGPACRTLVLEDSGSVTYGQVFAATP